MSFIKSENIHSKLTGTIIGCAFEVYNEPGMGFSEKIYQRSLDLELNVKELKVNWECSIPVYFKGVLVGKRRLDFVINNKVIFEVIARPYLHESDFIQLKNYLKITGIEIGLLLNFGSSSLQYQLCIYTIKNS